MGLHLGTLHDARKRSPLTHGIVREMHRVRSKQRSDSRRHCHADVMGCRHVIDALRKRLRAELEHGDGESLRRQTLHEVQREPPEGGVPSVGTDDADESGEQARPRAGGAKLGGVRGDVERGGDDLRHCGCGGGDGCGVEDAGPVDAGGAGLQGGGRVGSIRTRAHARVALR